MRAFIISGIPGAGKTTVARLIAESLPRAAHIEGDLIDHHLIVSGGVPPEGDPRDEAERQLVLRRRNICLLADSFAEDGFVPVIDDVVISPGVLNLYRTLLHTRPAVFVQLTPRLDVVRDRDAARDKHVFEIWQHLDRQMRDSMPRVGLWLDTTDLSAQKTVDAILARADEGHLQEGTVDGPG